jgi:hypothetical protein
MAGLTTRLDERRHLITASPQKLEDASRKKISVPERDGIAQATAQ